MSKVYFRLVMHEKLNLSSPKTFNAKIQLYKLKYCPNNELVIECTDKYRIRDYLQKKRLSKYAVPCLGFWENADDIEWDALPNRFAIKCNHGCAYNIICKDKNLLDIKKATKRLKTWLKEDFGKYNAEPHYSKIKRGIVCEEYLGDGKSEFLVDYKVHCFNGKVKFVLICSGRAQHSADYIYYDLNWNKLDFSKTASPEFPMPKSFRKMIEISEHIALDFPFVRVDFYEINGKPLIGELTFVPAGGLDNTITASADLAMGDMLKMPSFND